MNGIVVMLALPVSRCPLIFLDICWRWAALPFTDQTFRFRLKSLTSSSPSASWITFSGLQLPWHLSFLGLKTSNNFKFTRLSFDFSAAFFNIFLLDMIHFQGHCLLEMPSGTGKTISLLSLIVAYILVIIYITTCLAGFQLGRGLVSLELKLRG